MHPRQPRGEKLRFPPRVCARLSLSLDKIGCASASLRLKTSFSSSRCSRLSLSLHKAHRMKTLYVLLPLLALAACQGCGNQNGIDPRSIEYDNRAEEALQRFLHEGMPDTTAWAQAETFSDSVRILFRDVVDSCQTLLDSAVMYSPQSHLYYARKATLYLYCLDYGNALVWMKKALEKKGPPLASAQYRDAAAKNRGRTPSPDLVPSGGRPVPRARYLVASRRDELRSGPGFGRRKRTGPQSHRQPDKGHPGAGTTPADAGRSAGSSRCFSALTASFHLVIRFHCANCSIQAPHSPLM